MAHRAPDKRDELPLYQPQRGFLQPSGKHPGRWRADNEETMLELQDFKPARKRRVHLENLPEPQRSMERGYKLGEMAFANGKERGSQRSLYTQEESRTISTDAELSAFELGWDSAKRKADAEAR